MKENSEYIHLRNTSTSLHTSRFTRTQKICCHIYTQMKNDLQISKNRTRRLTTESEPWLSKNPILFFFFNSAKCRLWDDNFWTCSVVQLRGVGCGDRRMGHRESAGLLCGSGPYPFWLDWGQEGLLSQGIAELAFVLRNLLSLSVPMSVCSTNALSTFFFLFFSEYFYIEL